MFRLNYRYLSALSMLWILLVNSWGPHPSVYGAKGTHPIDVQAKGYPSDWRVALKIRGEGGLANSLIKTHNWGQSWKIV